MTNKWFFIAIGLGFLFFSVIMASSWKIFRIVRRHQHQVKDQDMAVSHLQNKTMNILKCRKSAATVLYIYGLYLSSIHGSVGGGNIYRLLALTLHLRYNTIVTVPRVFQTTIALWIFATVIVLPRFWMASKWHFIPIALGVLIFFVIVISVWKIFRIVRKHQQQIKGQTKAVSHLPANTVKILKCRNSAVTVLYIYGLLLIFYLPLMVLLVMEKFVGYTRTVRIVYEYAATAVFINSCLNPVVYCWRISEIRRAVKNFIRRSSRE